MKYTKTKYLEFYKDCMKSGTMPNNGLCNCIDMKEEVTPVDADDRCGYWAFEEDERHFWRDPNTARYGFNPLRQNLVLFMACMNGEL